MRKNKEITWKEKQKNEICFHMRSFKTVLSN